MKKEQLIIWRRLEFPGHEFARIASNQSYRSIDGTAIFVYESEACKLDYSIRCGNDWRTESAKVSGVIGEKTIEIEISFDGKDRWTLNGKEVSGVRGCTDIDLNFSPVTNSLPIRRLNLAVGEKSPVRAAWLSFPEFQLEPLDQVYERTGKRKYHYESDGGSFTTDLEVNDFGLIVNYPDLWQIENDRPAK